ncbi:sulfatase-like hydrolase/transferase [Maribellus comscasis]|uniref:Sulfatase-like hydrolase/transferase n=1 Tax=Maribellus comscasis TaxID=2681766 RepID=A0A6I6JLE1_9BACT|nr:arylsulfatase [Maribellus comscasis]QGY43675.1 sulfatase-like hydrolase/transferase [Maribellus comscasis]
MNKNWSAIYLLISVIIFGISTAGIAQKQQPNVVIIFTDDVGYGDIGCYGATKIKTPNIDRLAKEGRMFTDAHSASAVCTPSRYALITGSYPFRANKGEGVWGPLRRNNKLIIDTDNFTIAKLMKKNGYATACIGKWHLGFGEESPTDWNKPLIPGPLQLGFDYYFGIPFVSSGPPYVYVENDRVVGLEANDPLVLNGKPVSPTPQYSDKSPNTFSGGKKAHSLYEDEKIGVTLAGKAVDWIKQNKENPFFLYLATTNIHHPFTPNKKFQGTSECGRYGDFVHELDWIVGQVTNELEKLNILDNTLLIFTSDNGGMLNVGGQEAWRAGHRLNGNLLGFKFDAWEGGHRIPFIARWPKHIAPGTKSGQLLCHVDLFATLAAIIGYNLTEGIAPDSYNMLPALTGNPKNMLRDDLVLAPFHPENLAIRAGDWIYIGARGGGGWNGGKPGDHILGGPAALQFADEKNSDIADGAFKDDAADAQLYNLKKDISQKKNLIDKKPRISHMMNQRLKIIKQSQQTR